MQPESVFKAIADRTRHRALSVLSHQELNVSELVQVLDQPQSTVSRHLKVLRDAQLIQDRREGSTVLYSAARPREGAGEGELSDQLLSWFATQPVDSVMRPRLEAVVKGRRDMSRRFFDAVGARWDALREESFGATFHLEAFLALLPNEWVVADIGTGTGYLLPTLAGHFKRAIGIDPVRKMLDAARLRVEHHGLTNVELHNGDLERLPITEAAVDVAVAILVLHHVPVPRKALAELHRVTRPGGSVLIVEQSAHNNQAFRDRMQDTWWGFEPADFCSVVESVGFEGVTASRLSTVQRTPETPDLFVVVGHKSLSKRNDLR